MTEGLATAALWILAPVATAVCLLILDDLKRRRKK